jgi:hypothetical protein
MTTVTKDEIFDFIKTLKKKRTADHIESHLASEHILSKDWLSKEEEDAWKNL